MTQAHDPSSPTKSNIIHTAPDVKVTALQKELLEEAYAAYAPATVWRKLTTGKSGAEIYLVKRNDQRLEIAKFDHPYGLRSELKAYNDLVTKTSPEYRVELRGKVVQQADGHFEVALIESGDGQLGVLIYNFLGRDLDSADNSLLEYYKSNGSSATCRVLEHLFDAYGPQWWDSYSEKTVWYGEEYDRLLPVHLTVKRLRTVDGEANLLQSGKLEWEKLRRLKTGDIVQLKAFEITECRENVLRLRGSSPAEERSTDLRIKLDGLDPEHYQPGDSLPEVYAEITATRAELLAEEARKSHVHFSTNGTHFVLRGMRYVNPLQVVDELLRSERTAKTSIIHGDLNLRNIMVHKETGFAWLIDFAHTRSDGPTLFDLQRLEEHVIAEMVAPLLEKRKNGNDLVTILNALHSDPLNSKAPRAEWQPAYTLLHKIRELAKPYLPRKGGWGEYYSGLFLVFMGALKYNRTPYQRDLLLVGAATVQALMQQKVNDPYLPRKEAPMQKWLLSIAGLLLLVGGAVLGVQLSTWGLWGPTAATPAVADNTPPDVNAIAQALLPMIQTAVATQVTTAPPPTATPVPTLISTPTAAAPMTTLAQVRQRGYLRCGVAGDLPNFSVGGPVATSTYITETDLAQGFYEQAQGFDVDFCKGLAAAIFGSAREHVAYLNLTTGSEEPQRERFTAVAEGLVDVAFRNTTWTRDRELRVDFAQPIYLDGLKFMIYPSLLPTDTAVTTLKTGQETLDFVRELLVAGQKICVAEQTSTIDTLHKLFVDHPSQIIGELNNEQVALTYNAGRECQIMASDESQLLAYRQVYPNIKEHLIIPVDEMIAFEPLAPFVAQGDSEWRNVLNYTIWAIMYAEQLGITQDIAIRIAGLPDIDAIDQELMKLVATHQAFSLPQYKEFLGIEKAQEPIADNFAINHDFALRVIVQLGNYGEIFNRNLGNDFQRGINCVWEPLKPREAPNGCRLIIPPP